MGKTHAVREIVRRFPVSEMQYFDYFTKEQRPAPEPNSVLCRGMYKVNGTVKLVAFSSEGDGQEHVNNAFEILTNRFTSDLDVIVVACRTRGDSVFAIRCFAFEHHYNVIWTSLYHGRIYKTSDGYRGEALSVLPNGLDLNEIFANNIIVLMKNLLL